MLTTQSYLIAMLLYVLAAGVGVILLRRLWFSAPLTRASGMLLGAIAGALLAPAFPGAEVDTMAPALITVVFNGLFGEGVESALMPALWLLSGLVIGAVVGAWRAGRRGRRNTL